MSLSKGFTAGAALAAALGAAAPAAAVDVSAVAAACGPAVVLITQYAEGAERGLGSGFVVDAQGVIVTNYHVIGGADRATVKFTDGRAFDVEGVRGYDAARDLAVLVISAKDLPTLTLGDSDAPAVGSAVVAIGNPRGFENSVSEGVLSGRRELEGDRPFLQHTAPISPGSSGGPLLDAMGLVIGVNTLVYQGGQNLNFAVPSNVVKELLEERNVQELAAVSGSVEGMDVAELTQYAYHALLAGYLDKADTYFQRVIDEKPDADDGYVGRGLVALEREDYDAAARFFKKAADKTPDNAYNYYNAGVAYKAMGKSDEALASFERAYSLDPADKDFFLKLVYAYGEAERYGDAVALCRERLKTRANDVNALYIMGRCQVKNGDHEEGKETIEKLLVVEPNAVFARTDLGYAYLGLGKNGTAADEFEKTLAVRGALDDLFVYEAYLGLGQARLAMGHHKKAREAFREAVALAPEDAAAHLGLGRACVKGGDLEAAAEEYEALKDLDKDAAAELKEAIDAAAK